MQKERFHVQQNRRGPGCRHHAVGPDAHRRHDRKLRRHDRGRDAGQAGIKAVKKHRAHRYVVRHGTRTMKVLRHGKVTYVKVKARHHAMHAKKPVRQGTNGNKARAG